MSGKGSFSKVNVHFLQCMTIVRVLSLCFDSHSFLNVFNSMVYLETGSRSVFVLTLSVQYFDILRIVFVCPICQSQLAR